MRAVCEGAHACCGKVEILCHSAQTLGTLFRNNIKPAMSSADWSQAQFKYPILRQIIETIHNNKISTWKLKPDMDSDLKALMRIRK